MQNLNDYEMKREQVRELDEELREMLGIEGELIESDLDVLVEMMGC